MKLSSLLFPLFAFSLTSATWACDLCASSLPPVHGLHGTDLNFYGGVTEQFTRMGSLRFEGHEVENPTGQYLNSSTTQLFFGTFFLENRLGLQIDVPLIYRTYKRPEGFEIEHGNESGLGDISLLANFVVLKKDGLFHSEDAGLSKDGKAVVVAVPDFSIGLNLVAGIKLPTGDSSRLKEEFNEVEVEGAPESGIHGHDLALGTGSYDAIVAAQFFVRYQRLFLQADSQFTLRGDGRHSYHYANDLSWSGGPGFYLVRKEPGFVALQVVLSGEYKDTDRFQGRVAADTGITSLYVGPRLTAQYGRVSADIGLDLPVLLDNTALQIVPDYRIRAGLAIRF